MKKYIQYLGLALLCGSIFIFLGGCATKDIGAEAFKNMTAQQILAEGEKELTKHNYKDAIKRFDAIDALYPFAPEAEQAQIDVIYAYYKSDQVDTAIIVADRYIHLYPQGPHTAYAYYMKGLMNFNRSKHFFQKWHPVKMEQRDITNMQQSFVDFNELLSLFPNSVYAKDAYEHMLSARDYMAQHELNVAQFYFDRKAYVAAANRASYVVKHYPGSQQTFAALKLMLESYRALGAQDQVNDTLRIINLNYPKEKI